MYFRLSFYLVTGFIKKHVPTTIMKEDFDYKQVPHNYVHCLHAQCQSSAECLHFLVTQYATPEIKFFPALNPTHIISKGGVCPYFHQDQMECFALGITHLFDNLPYKKALKVRRMLYLHLKRNTFYRIQRKERLINPAELSLIREVFQKEGIQEEPLFDEFIYKYNWEPNN